MTYSMLLPIQRVQFGGNSVKEESETSMCRHNTKPTSLLSNHHRQRQKTKGFAYQHHNCWLQRKAFSLSTSCYSIVHPAQYLQWSENQNWSNHQSYSLSTVTVDPNMKQVARHKLSRSTEKICYRLQSSVKMQKSVCRHHTGRKGQWLTDTY